MFDLLKMTKEGTKNEPSLDIIVSNPPYICEKEKADMAKNVLNYEPGLALFVPDEDPLRFYRAIAEIAARNLSTEEGSTSKSIPSTRRKQGKCSKDSDSRT